MNINSIKRFVKDHEEWFLGSVAIFMIVGIIWTYIWGITFLTEEISKAVSPPENIGADTRANIDTARGLDLRGLNE